MTNFMNAIKDEMLENHNEARTENGALAYETTGKALLDLNFMIPQLRSMNDEQLTEKWYKAYYENPILALRWLFYLRDVRNGIGERSTFRRIMNILANSVDKNNIAKSLVTAKANDYEYLIPFFGRWDDVIELLRGPIHDIVSEVIKTQKDADWKNFLNEKPISLLAKWLPSVNTSSKSTKAIARSICSDWKMDQRTYRKLLSTLRRYIDVVEKKMSANQWNEIKYERVPSKANLRYANAFMKHDEERRKNYLESLKKGETKINSSVAFPHDIVHKVAYDPNNLDTYDAMWNSLPNLIKNDARVMVVCDGSGSMECRIPNSNVEAIEVSNALAIYFAERLQGEFHNKFMTFGGRPQFVDISNCITIYDKYKYARKFDDCSNTNLVAVFDLILSTAVHNHMKQEDLPTSLLFISDMEFDDGVYIDINHTNNYWYHDATTQLRESKLLEQISTLFNNYGYKIPRIIFWNVNSRSNAIPMIKNDLGITLLSGYSVNLVNMVMSQELDPYKCLVDQLMNPRYDCVENAVKNLV